MSFILPVITVVAGLCVCAILVSATVWGVVRILDKAFRL